MNDKISFKRIATASAILSAPIALASWVLVAIAVNFNFDAASDLSDVINFGAPAAEPFHLAWAITDVFGYCLLLAPAVLYLWRWLKPRNSDVVTLSTFFGFAYVLTGAIAASLLGGAVPSLMRSYELASELQRDVLLVLFQTVFNLVYYGLAIAWLFGGLWWFGIGMVLKNERRSLGITTIILGIMSIIVWGEQTFRFEPLVAIETPFLLLIPMWAVWLGIVISRQGEKSEYSMKLATAD